MINLKDNIWIEGFDSKRKFITSLSKGDYIDNPIIYKGKTSEIPKEIAKEYFDYGYDDLEIHFTSLKEAIQSTCSKEYCIIYRKQYETYTI